MNRIKTILFILYLSFTGMLHAHVELVYPQGGETVAPGQVITIEWNELVMHNTLNWDLYYSTDEGATWDVLEEDIPYTNLTYDWSVPNDSTDQARVMIVQDNNGMDYSDQSGDFTIAPTTGVENHYAGTFGIYPNPANNTLHIDASVPVTAITISDIRSENTDIQFRQATGTGYQADVSELPAGIYIVKLRTEKGLAARKLIVRH